MDDIISTSPPASLAKGGRSPNRAREAGGATKHYFAKHKTEIVLRLLRGETLEALSRELGVTAAVLSSWRDTFLVAGSKGLSARKTSAQEEETKRFTAKIGEQAMEIELLREKIVRMEQKSPLAYRRSKK